MFSPSLKIFAIENFGNKLSRGSFPRLQQCSPNVYFWTDSISPRFWSRYQHRKMVSFSYSLSKWRLLMIFQSTSWNKCMAQNMFTQRTRSVLLLKLIGASSYILSYILTIYHCSYEGVCRWPWYTGMLYYTWEIYYGLYSVSYNGPIARFYNIVCFMVDTPLIMCMLYFGNGASFDSFLLRAISSGCIIFLAVFALRSVNEGYFSEVKFIFGFLIMTMHYFESYSQSALALTRSVPILLCLGNLSYTLSSWTRDFSSKWGADMSRISMILMMISSVLYVFHRG